jgi:hypothetical protein
VIDENWELAIEFIRALISSIEKELDMFEKCTLDDTFWKV